MEKKFIVLQSLLNFRPNQVITEKQLEEVLAVSKEENPEAYFRVFKAFMKANLITFKYPKYFYPKYFIGETRYMDQIIMVVYSHVPGTNEYSCNLGLLGGCNYDALADSTFECIYDENEYTIALKAKGVIKVDGVKFDDLFVPFGSTVYGFNMDEMNGFKVIMAPSLMSEINVNDYEWFLSEQEMTQYVEEQLGSARTGSEEDIGRRDGNSDLKAMRKDEDKA